MLRIRIHPPESHSHPLWPSMVQSTSETYCPYLLHIVVGQHTICIKYHISGSKQDKRSHHHIQWHLSSSLHALHSMSLYFSPLHPCSPTPAMGASSFCLSQAQLSNTMDTLSSGELSNAGFISASASEAEEVEESEWCVNEAREMEKGRKGGIGWE